MKFFTAFILLLSLVSCTGPCLSEADLTEEVHFHYRALSTMAGGGSWSVSNIEIVSERKNASKDTCVSFLVVSGIYSNASIAGAEASSIFSDTIKMESFVVNDQHRVLIKYN